MTLHIGIVACSAEGAALCYRTICVEGAAQLGPHGHPEVSMHTHSLAAYMDRIYLGDWPGVAELMLSSDGKGQMLSYLATEENFNILRSLEQKNLIVPVVGNFGGRRALRAVGQYVRDHAATVGAFYLSNVEQYLRQDGIFSVFCANVASMPLDDRSTFIRSFSNGGGGNFQNALGEMQAEVRGCAGTTAPASVR